MGVGVGVGYVGQGESDPGNGGDWAGQVTGRVIAGQVRYALGLRWDQDGELDVYQGMSMSKSRNDTGVINLTLTLT